MQSSGQTRARRLVALPRGGGSVFLAWRLLPSDPADAPFEVERREGAGWRRVTSRPVLDSTNFLDTGVAPQEAAYRVVGGDGVPSEVVRVAAGAGADNRALDVPLDPEGRLQGVIAGELCNDGRLGFVVRMGLGGTVRLVAHAADGRHLWTYDTRLPDRGGWDGSMHHVPFLCWDLNGDGRVEVATHAFGGRFPAERYDTAVAGEVLVALDGETGRPLWTVPWPAGRSRVVMTAAHLQERDAPAAVIVQDGTYGDLTLTAVGGVDGRRIWQIFQARPGGHNLDVADIDGDGLQEVVCGGMCYAGDGSLRWQAEPFGHTDISKPARIDPRRQGLQIWYAVESPREQAGVYLVDCDGTTLFKEPFRHAHYGWIARHAPGVPGLHPHTAEDARTGVPDGTDGHFPIFLPDGSHWLNLTDWQRKNFVPVQWDEGPEVVFAVRKENKRIVRLLAGGETDDLPEGALPAGGEYGRNLCCIDAIGDYRENIVALDAERHRLMLLVNPVVARHRGRSPWDDFGYRHDRSQLGSGYYIYLSPPDTVVR